MTTHVRLLAIVVAVSGLGLSAASAADTWKGAWKFEMDRWDRPWLVYYDTRGKTVFSLRLRHAFRDGCGLSGGIAGTGPHQGLDHDRQRQDADGFRRLHLLA